MLESFLFQNTTSPSSPPPNTRRRAPGGSEEATQRPGAGRLGGACTQGPSAQATSVTMPGPRTSALLLCKTGCTISRTCPEQAWMGQRLGHTQCQVVRGTRRAAECWSHCPHPANPGLSPVPHLLGKALRSGELLFCARWDAQEPGARQGHGPPAEWGSRGTPTRPKGAGPMRRIHSCEPKS